MDWSLEGTKKIRSNRLEQCSQEYAFLDHIMPDVQYHRWAKELRNLLLPNHSLTTLLLKHNNIGDEGAIALSNALKQNNSLTRLDLGPTRPFLPFFLYWIDFSISRNEYEWREDMILHWWLTLFFSHRMFSSDFWGGDLKDQKIKLVPKREWAYLINQQKKFTRLE